MTAAIRLKTPFAIALAILAIAVSSIVGAFVFEAFGYAPCELCLKERIPYYAAIPVAWLALLFSAQGLKTLLRAGFVVLTLIFTASVVLGAYHAGVEWGLWPGPSACTGALEHASSSEDFLKQLESVKVARCDAPALRILGLSLAGWNALISGALIALSVAGLRANH